MSGWELLILLSKSLTYLAMLAVPGALLVLLLLRRADPRSVHAAGNIFLRQLLLHYLFPAVILGIFSLSLFFLAQVGAVNQQGVAGMFDRDMAAIMATTALGDGVQWRLYGFMLAALASGLMFLEQKAARASPHWHSPIHVLLILATALFVWSFAILGHTSVLGVSAQLSVALHLLAVGVWVGALVPLWILCRVHDGEGEDKRLDDGLPVLADVMEDFGRTGLAFIPVLLITGIYLLFKLLETPQNLFDSVYGRLLVTKMMVAGALMALGAWNKFRLVPPLRDTSQHPANLLRLRRSIQAEMSLTMLILLIVASFTTAFGPMS